MFILVFPVDTVVFFFVLVSLWCMIVIVEPLPLNEMAIRHNAAMIEYCRTSISALAGSTAGILGLTGLYGFIFYFITALMMSV